MHPYEAIVIFDPAIDGDEAVDAQLTRLVSIIVDNGGELEKVDKWGKRKLAYEINGHTEGYYAVIDFRAPTTATAEWERVVKITDEVIRYLVIRKES